jgi:hypothetical protein
MVITNITPVIAAVHLEEHVAVAPRHLTNTSFSTSVSMLAAPRHLTGSVTTGSVMGDLITQVSDAWISDDSDSSFLQLPTPSKGWSHASILTKSAIFGKYAC